MITIRFLIAAIIVSVCCASVCTAEPKSYEEPYKQRVIIVGRKTSSNLSQLAHELRQLVWQATISVVPKSELNQTLIRNRDVIVTVGAKSFRAIAGKEIDNLIVATYISNGAYNNIVKERNPFSIAVLSEPPVSEQVSLISGLYAGKGIIRLGVILSEKTKQIKRELQQSAASHGIDLIVREIKGKITAKDIAYLNQQNLTVLLLVHDPTIINPSSGHMLKLLLETSYSNGYGIVGFSKNFVSNGSIASIHYSPKHIALAVNEQLNNDSPTGPKNDSEHPRNFSIAINKTVAKSLGLFKSDVEELVNKIKKNASFIDASFEFVYVNEATESIL